MDFNDRGGGLCFKLPPFYTPLLSIITNMYMGKMFYLGSKLDRAAKSSSSSAGGLKVLYRAVISQLSSSSTQLSLVGSSFAKQLQTKDRIIHAGYIRGRVAVL